MTYEVTYKIKGRDEEVKQFRGKQAARGFIMILEQNPNVEWWTDPTVVEIQPAC